MRDVPVMVISAVADTRLFEEARAKAPAVLFFDEVEALGGRRTNTREHSRYCERIDFIPPHRHAGCFSDQFSAADYKHISTEPGIARYKYSQDPGNQCAQCNIGQVGDQLAYREILKTWIAELLDTALKKLLGGAGKDRKRA